MNIPTGRICLLVILQKLQTQVSYSGGNAQTRFLISGNYRDETTVLLGDKGFKRGGALLSISHNSLNNKFGISATANYTSDDNKNIATDISQYHKHVAQSSTV